MIRWLRLPRILFGRHELKPEEHRVEKLKEFGQRVAVVLKAAPTYLVAISTAITIFSEEIVKILPDEWDLTVARWATIAVGFLGAVITIIRRVTPVLPADRGLLSGPPPEGYAIGQEAIKEETGKEGVV